MAKYNVKAASRPLRVLFSSSRLQAPQFYRVFARFGAVFAGRQCLADRRERHIENWATIVCEPQSRVKFAAGNRIKIDDAKSGIYLLVVAVIGKVAAADN